MSELKSLLGGLIVIGILVWLISSIVGGRFKVPSLTSFGRRKGGMGLGRSPKSGNRTAIELGFSLFAVANLAFAQSASKLDALGLVVLMLVLVAALAYISQLLVVVVGGGAAVADLYLTEGAEGLLVVLLIVLMLAWLIGATGQFGGRR
ncbi:MAG: hypothetical protein WB507_03655 [Solirubrobacterales bacterium]